MKPWISFVGLAHNLPPFPTKHGSDNGMVTFNNQLIPLEKMCSQGSLQNIHQRRPNHVFKPLVEVDILWWFDSSKAPSPSSSHIQGSTKKWLAEPSLFVDREVLAKTRSCPPTLYSVLFADKMLHNGWVGIVNHGIVYSSKYALSWFTFILCTVSWDNL